jgi:hypothetical protein
VAIWYAQNASTNIDAANQWNAAPDGSGAWLTWANLQPTDVLCANGKMNLYVAAGFTCATITTSGGGTGADGGRFDVQTGAQTFTLTCDVVAGTTPCLITLHSSGTVAIIGDVTAGGSTNARGIWKFAGAGTLTVEGAITGGSGRDCHGLFHQGAGGATVVTGSATGGTSQAVHGIHVTGAGATVTLNGNATGGTSSNTQYMAAGVCNGHATAVVTVNGNALAGTGVAAPGVYGQAGPVTVIGSLVDSATCGAAYGKLYWQPASVAHYWQVAWNGSLDQRYTESPGEESVRYGLQFGYNGVTLMTGSMVVPAVTDVRAGVGYDDEAKTLGTLALPAEADVKTGVGYGGAGTEYTGTLVAGGGGVPLIGPGGLVG